jgi:hypothetical protein
MNMITTRLRQRAAIYRDMARKSFDPTLRREFTHRAERYETVAWAVEHERCELEYSAVEGRRQEGAAATARRGQAGRREEGEEGQAHEEGEAADESILRAEGTEETFATVSATSGL